MHKNLPLSEYCTVHLNQPVHSRTSHNEAEIKNIVFAINLPFNFLVEPFQYLQTHKNFVLSMIRLANQAVSSSPCIFTSNDEALL